MMLAGKIIVRVLILNEFCSICEGDDDFLIGSIQGDRSQLPVLHLRDLCLPL